jgi:sporulation protein YlmC with PRC-barrel domain
MIMGTQVLSASTLSGDKVRNPQGEDLGKVEDFMLDLDSGRIVYAVLSFGGVMGVGNKLFAVPPAALTIDKEEKCLVLDVDKGQLERAPGFDKDNWPDLADPRLGSEIYSYYGRRPYWS